MSIQVTANKSPVIVKAQVASSSSLKVSMANTATVKCIDVSDATINNLGHLIVTLSDGTVIDAGLSKGEKGDPGKYVSSASLSSDGVLTLTMSDNSTITVGNVRGPQGESIEMAVNSGVIQWRLPSGSWNDLVTIASLKGDKGDAATVSVGTVSTGVAGSNVSITNKGTPAAAIFDFSIPRGDKGETATVAVGKVTTGAPGANAAVTNSGTNNDAILDFTIPQGLKGNTGDAATLSIGTVTTGAPGTSVSVSNSGDSHAAVIDFTIPKGDKGDAATVKVGTVSTGSAGSNASISNSGTDNNAILDFSIPRGDKGLTGNAATIAVGTVSTGEPGSSVSVTNSGTSGAAILNFTIPKGAKGDPGTGTGDMKASVYDAAGGNKQVAFADDLSSHSNNTEIHVTATQKSAWDAKQDALTFDDSPTANSSNPVRSSGIKTALDEKSDTNHTHSQYLTAHQDISGKMDKSVYDPDGKNGQIALNSDLTAHTGDSGIHVTTAQKASWDSKQSTLTFDSTPTSGSANPVTSDGIYRAIRDFSDTTIYQNTSVPVSLWISSTTYTKYPYSATATVSGITSGMIPTLVFGMDDASSGNYGPVAVTGDSTITIYAIEKPTTDLSIPFIICITP